MVNIKNAANEVDSIAALLFLLLRLHISPLTQYHSAIGVSVDRTTY